MIADKPYGSSGKHYCQGRIFHITLTGLGVLLLLLSMSWIDNFVRYGQVNRKPTLIHQGGSWSTRARDQYGIFVGVLSASDNIQARQAIRDTWGADHRLLRVVFVTLRPASNTTLAKLQLEAVKHGDMLMVSEMENYYNITHATIAVFRAAVGMGPLVKFVLKTDDDCYIRVPKLLEALHDAPPQLLYAGYPLRPTRLHRSGKYAISWSMWPHHDAKVRYAWGAGYVLSADLARFIAAGAPHQITPHMVQIEDMAVGLWVESIAKQNNSTIHYHYFHYNGSCDAQSVAVHVKEKTGATLRCIHQKFGQCCHVG